MRTHLIQFKRSDGRAPNQIRPVKITPHYLATAEGSVLVEAGATKIICAASVEQSVPGFRKGTGLGWITAEYSMLPRSTNTRTPREVSRGRPSGRTSEIQRLIGRSLRAAVDFSKLGERSIFIDCDVVQADGGTRTAAVTGGWLALALAVRRMLAFEFLQEDPVIRQIAAVSVGVIKGVPLLDLCYEEDARAQTDMNVVMTSQGEYIELQATAENSPFSRDHLSGLLALAEDGIAALLEAQTKALEA